MLQTNKILKYLAIAITLAVLYVFSVKMYLFFHVTVEFFSIAIAVVVFIVTFKARDYINNNYLTILGYAYLFIAFLDFLHTLGYKGMNIFTDYDYYANQLWIAARLLESSVLVISLWSISWKKKVNVKYLIIGLFVVTSTFIITIFPTDIFPECFIAGVGQTPFKIYSEVFIIFLLTISLAILLYEKRAFEKDIFKYILISIIFTVFSELAFIFYIDNYGLSNIIGHFFKVISFYYIYKAVVLKGITEPYNLIFKELNELKESLKNQNEVLINEVKYEALTGLYSRKYLTERIQMDIKIYNRHKTPFTLLFMDLDDFKKINDTYGHTEGDRVIKEFAELLKDNMRDIDCAGRFGGDEFIVVLANTAHDEASLVGTRLLEKISRNDFSIPQSVTVSIGMKTYEGEGFDELIKYADDGLYAAKSQGKNTICEADCAGTGV